MGAFSDDFTRADASTLGSPWTEHAGDWGILSNRGRCTSDSGNSDDLVWATVDGGRPTQLVEWEMTDWQKGPVYLVFRFVDTDNLWFLAGTNNDEETLFVFRRLAGVESMEAIATGVTWGAGYRLSVVTTPSRIRVYVDNTEVNDLNVASSVHGAATRAGLGGTARSSPPETGPNRLQAARWSFFSITPLPGARRSLGLRR
jgi:hypothetical protein